MLREPTAISLASGMVATPVAKLVAILPVPRIPQRITSFITQFPFSRAFWGNKKSRKQRCLRDHGKRHPYNPSVSTLQLTSVRRKPRPEINVTLSFAKGLSAAVFCQRTREQRD